MGSPLVLASLLLLVLIALGIVIWWPFGGLPNRPARGQLKRAPNAGGGDSQASAPTVPLRRPRRPASPDAPAQQPSAEPSLTQPSETAPAQAPEQSVSSLAPAPEQPVPSAKPPVSAPPETFPSTAQPLPAASNSPAQPVTQSPAQPRRDRFQTLADSFASTRADLAALPQSLDERRAWAAETQNLQGRLDNLRASPSSVSAQTDEEWAQIEQHLDSIHEEARAAGAQFAVLAERERRLTEQAFALGDDLGAAAKLSPYPLGLEQTSAAGAAALARVSHIPARSAIASRAALAVRLQEGAELLAEIARCRSAVAQARSQREQLLALLAGPGLRDDASWNRSLQNLVANTRAAGNNHGATGAPLLADANRLLARRLALFDFCAPSKGGGYTLPEQRLPALLVEATALRDEIRALWRRARKLLEA